jgi:hypothetical protein
MKKLETCHHCGEQKEDCYHGHIAMTLPIPEAETLIEKWNLIDAYKTYLGQFDELDPIEKLSAGSIFIGAMKPFIPFTQEEFIDRIKNHEWFSKKWYTKTWWKNLERTDLTEEEIKELDGLCTYDQLLSTVGRGVQCDDCAAKEEELYEKYYPRNLES